MLKHYYLDGWNWERIPDEIVIRHMYLNFMEMRFLIFMSFIIGNLFVDTGHDKRYNTNTGSNTLYTCVTE